RLSLTIGKKLIDAASRAGGVLIALTTPEAPAGAGCRLGFKALGLEGLEVEVLRSRQGGLSSVRLGWERLYPQAPGWRHRLPGDVPLRRSVQAANNAPAFYRENSSIHRNGCDGVCGQRPGRDLAMPPLTTRRAFVEPVSEPSRAGPEARRGEHRSGAV